MEYQELPKGHQLDGSIFDPDGYTGAIEYVSDVEPSPLAPELLVSRRIATFKDGKLIGIKLGRQSHHRIGMPRS